MTSFPDEPSNREFRNGRWVEIAPGSATSMFSYVPFPVLDLPTLAAQSPRAADWVVEKVIGLGEIFLHTGAPGVGKSLLMLMIAIAMAAGLRSVLGMAIIPGPAIYFSCEDSLRELHWRIAAICRALGVDMASLSGRLYVVNRRGELDNLFGAFNLDGSYLPTDTYRRLVEMIGSTGARLCVVDHVAHVFPGNENDRQQVTRQLAPLAKDAEALECSLVLIGHENKAGNTYSGTTAWPAAVRGHLHLAREDGGDPDARVLQVAKSNYARTGDAARFRWHDHSFILDADLPPSVAAQLAEVSRLNAANDAFLACLAKATEQGRNVSHAGGSNYAPKVFARMQAGKAFGQDELAAAMERLLDMGLIAANQEIGRYDNRTSKRGLAIVNQPAQGAAQTAAKAVHEPAQGEAQRLHKDAQAQPLSPTGIDGGAHEWPAPSPSDLDWGDEVDADDD